MLHAGASASQKRARLRERLASGELLRFRGAINPLSPQLIEEKGFEGVYESCKSTDLRQDVGCDSICAALRPPC